MEFNNEIEINPVQDDILTTEFSYLDDSLSTHTRMGDTLDGIPNSDFQTPEIKKVSGIEKKKQNVLRNIGLVAGTTLLFLNSCNTPAVITQVPVEQTRILEQLSGTSTVETIQQEAPRDRQEPYGVCQLTHGAQAAHG